MTNYSGIVNKQDASDHGAAVIYGNGNNKSAVDNYLDTIAVEAKAKQAENKAIEQDAARANVNVLSQMDKAWSPHSQDIHNQYEEWQKLQKQALQTRNPKEKYDLQAKADMQRAKIITTVNYSEEQKKSWQTEDVDMIKNFDNWDDEDIAAHKSYIGRTDVDPFNEPYIPSGRKMQDRLLNDLKKVKISPTYTVENKKERVEGKDYDAYYENATITQEQIDSGYNTFMSTPSSIKSKARFIATRTQQSVPYANAEKEWEQNIKSQILANSGGGEQVVDANGKVSYVNRKKKGNVSEWGPSPTFNFGGDGNGAVNKSGTIVMSVQAKADGSEDISLSNTGIDGKTADFVAPSTKALIKTIATGITFDPRAKDQVEIVNPTYTISPDRKTITMSATVASTLQQTMIRPEEKKLYTITNVPILKDGDYVGEGKAIWESLNIQQKFNITIDENGVVSKTPNATTRQTVGNKVAPKTAPKTAPAPKTQAAPASNLRADGTVKGKGYFGELKMQDGSNKVATEISIGVQFDGKETEIPTLVPTLTNAEINWLLKGNNPNDKSEIGNSIVNKAIDHAVDRRKKGLSPFKDGGGQKKAAPAPAAPAAPGSRPRRQVKVVNGKIVTVVNGKIVP